MKRIESLSNSFIKNLIKLQEKSRERKKQGLFVIEGKREIELALKSSYEISTILFVPELLGNMNLDSLSNIELIEISPEIYKRVAYRDSTEGIIALAKSKSLELSELTLTNNPLLLVVESIEKPGNVGAMLRTADAARIDAVILADAKTDIYNPNVIRSSIGCVFTNQIAVGTSNEVIAFLKSEKINIYCATLQNDNDYTKTDFSNPSAIVVGSEANGLTKIWRTNATQQIVIPMEGEIDSMNVSVSSAILLFEAKRQRK